jgi:hypothetical protein
MSILIRTVLVLVAIVVVLLLAGRTSRAADECITSKTVTYETDRHRSAFGALRHVRMTITNSQGQWLAVMHAINDPTSIDQCNAIGVSTTLPGEDMLRAARTHLSFEGGLHRG